MQHFGLQMCYISKKILLKGEKLYEKNNIVSINVYYVILYSILQAPTAG